MDKFLSGFIADKAAEAATTYCEHIMAFFKEWDDKIEPLLSDVLNGDPTVQPETILLDENTDDAQQSFQEVTTDFVFFDQESGLWKSKVNNELCTGRTFCKKQLKSTKKCQFGVKWKTNLKIPEVLCRNGALLVGRQDKANS